jgi:hypothetical protein
MHRSCIQLRLDSSEYPRPFCKTKFPLLMNIRIGRRRRDGSPVDTKHDRESGSSTNRHERTLKRRFTKIYQSPWEECTKQTHSVPT